MKEYVGCKVEFLNKRELIMYQDGLVKKMLRIFGSEVEGLHNYDTPASTGYSVIRPTEEEPALSKEKQTRYRSGIGILMFLIKYSRPDIANSVRELSKVNDRATEGQYRELLRVIKHVKDTRNHGLKYDVSNYSIDDIINWVVIAFCDSDFAGDKNNRKSVTGYGIYIMGCLVAWKSRGQKTVSLSSSEAEYLAIADVCTEILFIRNLLTFFGIKIAYPITVRCDNVGAIFLGYNAKTSSRTKHVDIKAHFVREYVNEGIIKIVFVRSENNDSDIWTKNTDRKTYVKHRSKFMGNREVANDKEL